MFAVKFLVFTVVLALSREVSVKSLKKSYPISTIRLINYFIETFQIKAQDCITAKDMARMVSKIVTSQTLPYKNKKVHLQVYRSMY